MKKLLIVGLFLATASLANAGMWISVNGTVDPNKPVEVKPGNNLIIGINGDGMTPRGYFFLGVIADGFGSLDISGATIPYPGNDRSIEWIDDEEFASYLDIDNPFVFISLNDYADQPTPLNGILVDNIIFRCEDIGNVMLVLFDENGNILNTQIIHQVAIPGAILLLAPNGGEILSGGSIYPVSWSCTVDINDVTIKYSTDNGSSWFEVDPPNKGNTGSYNWFVPRVNSNRCLIRVSDANNPGVRYTSDSVFTIETYIPVPMVISLTDTAAEAILNEVGLAKGKVVSEYSNVVPLGNIISQNPSAGTSVMLGSAIDLVISLGIEPEAKTFYVDDNAVNDPRPGDPCVSDPLEDGSAEHPFDAIQKAIDIANNRDAVVVLPGIYTGEGNRDIDFKGKAITVRSTDPNDPNVVASTVIDCQSKDRGFNFHSGETSPSVLAGLTITNGLSDRGAGIWCQSSSPTIYRCSVVGNTAVGGNNPSGAGICCDAANPQIIQCRVFNNSTSGANAWGGGICCNGCCPNIINCAIVKNSAQKGGGIYCNSAAPTVSNCTIADNMASFSGGGIEAYQDKVVVNNCIVWGNTGSELEGYFFDELAVSYSDVRGGRPGIGNIDKPPSFVNAAAYDYHLLPDSPCIDAGDPEFIDSNGQTDIDLERRIINHRVDIGAYEVGYEQPFISVSSNKFYFSVYKGSPGLKQAVLQISNEGFQVLHWQINKDCPWLEVNPSEGVCADNTSDVNLFIDANELNEGIYKAQITVTANGAVNNPCTLLVILSVLSERQGNLIVGLKYPTIQAAINDASNGDTIVICPGTYTGDSNRNIDFRGKSITVTGIDSSDPEIIAATVIDCQGKGRGFTFHSGEDHNSVLSGLTITNGYPSYETFELGGTNYMWIVGGAIFCNNASPTLRDCLFTRNTVTSGNSRGGAIYCLRSSPHLERCIITDNTSESTGGGLRCDENCYPTLSNCILANNETFTGGGNAICSYTSIPTLTNCTLFDNSSVSIDGWYNCPVIFRNIILWANSSVWLSAGCDIAYSDVRGGYPGIGNIDIDPCFVNVLGGNYHLQADSQCINAGDPNYTAIDGETDIYSNSRVMLGRIDVGADEFNPFIIGFAVVKKNRIGRVVFEYECQAIVENISRFTIKNLKLEIVKASGNVTIIEPNVTFDAAEIGAGESARSFDTCIIDVNRAQPINPVEIVWSSTCQVSDSNQTMHQMLSAYLPLESGNIAGDLTGDGKINLDDLSVLANQWLDPPGIPSADVAPLPLDGIVNFLDFAIIANNWMK